MKSRHNNKGGSIQRVTIGSIWVEKEQLSGSIQYVTISSIWVDKKQHQGSTQQVTTGVGRGWMSEKIATAYVFAATESDYVYYTRVSILLTMYIDHFIPNNWLCLLHMCIYTIYVSHIVYFYNWHLTSRSSPPMNPETSVDKHKQNTQRHPWRGHSLRSEIENYKLKNETKK